MVAAQLPEAGFITISELERTNPLGRFPEIEVRDQEPGRAAVIALQRLTAEPGRNHCFAADQIRHRNIGCVAFLAGRERVIGRWLKLGIGQERIDGYPFPDRIELCPVGHAVDIPFPCGLRQGIECLPIPRLDRARAVLECKCPFFGPDVGGEAGGHHRETVGYAFSFGIPIGGAIGLAFGGIIATAFDWRTAFITMGAAGLLIAPVFRWLVRDPVRGGAEHGPVEHGPADERPKLAAAIRIIARKPAFWLISFGSALGSTASYGISFWIPSFYVRSFDMPLSQVTLLYAAIILSGGITGIWLGAWLGDRIGPRRPGAYIAIPMWALLVSIPFFALAVLATSPMLSMGLLFIPTMLGSMGYGTVLAAVQNVVPATLRSTASALFLFINNLIGLGLGSAVLGFISDKLTQQYGAQSLRYALLSGALFYLAAAIFYLMAARRVAKDWEA